MTRLFANLPEILDRLPPLVGHGAVTSRSAARAHEGTTFEASCYTDPLALEPWPDALAETVEWFAGRPEDMGLRFTPKFGVTDRLVGAAHGGRIGPWA